MNLYDIQVEKMTGVNIPLSTYQGKTLLIVNTASKCGFTPQFEGLEALYQKYKDQNFVVLGFPCNQFLNQDPGSNEDILSFCQLNYGVTFPMFSKLSVRGKNQHPLFKYLIQHSPVRKGKSIKWNFEKFLINKEGDIVNRYVSKVTPEDIESDIEAIL